VREERAELAAEALKTEDPSPSAASSLDMIDWDAVMRAPVEEVVNCIRCRGMHYMLTKRIQGLLRRIHRERGCLSLEFLHDCPTELARGYLLSLEVGKKNEEARSQGAKRLIEPQICVLQEISILYELCLRAASTLWGTV
jgi:endonuclease III